MTMSLDRLLPIHRNPLIQARTQWHYAQLYRARSPSTPPYIVLATWHPNAEPSTGIDW